MHNKAQETDKKQTLRQSRS